jgi:hypothetical protein
MRWKNLQTIRLPAIKIHNDSPNFVLRIPQWEQLHTLSVTLHFQHYERALFPAIRYLMVSVKLLCSLEVTAVHEGDTKNDWLHCCPAVSSATIPFLNQLVIKVRSSDDEKDAPDSAADSLMCGFSFPRLCRLEVFGHLRFSARCLLAQCPALSSLELHGGARCSFDSVQPSDWAACRLKVFFFDSDDISDKQALDVLASLPGLLEFGLFASSCSLAFLLGLSLVGHRNLEHLSFMGTGISTKVLRSLLKALPRLRELLCDEDIKDPATIDSWKRVCAAHDPPVALDFD